MAVEMESPRGQSEDALTQQEAGMINTHGYHTSTNLDKPQFESCNIQCFHPPSTAYKSVLFKTCIL